MSQLGGADGGDGGAVVICPAGSHPVTNLCVDDQPGTYTVTVAVREIPADGVTKIPVIVSGRALDGTPSKADVILSTSRVGAGDFSPSATYRLGSTPTNLFFIPCSVDRRLPGVFQDHPRPGQ
jgi:hypothetical protein